MSMAIIGITTTVIGTSISVYGQQQAAKAAEYTASYNNQLATQQAAHETKVATENARRKTRDNARMIGLQRNAVAANGFAMAGTPLAVLGDSVASLQKDIMDMAYEAAARSTQLRSAAALGLTDAANTATGLRTSSYATALSGVSSATTGFLKAKG